MKIGFIGLGKMGSNMVERLLQHNHQVVAYDLSEKARKEVSDKGAETATSLAGLVKKLEVPRAVWVMVPAGKPTEDTVSLLSSLLQKGDVIIDGGNSYYKDSIKRAEQLKGKGIFFLDAGTSGGIWGLRVGYCLMVGGEKDAFLKLEPIFKALAPKDGYAHLGKNGAGHFVKMVHNGIEYSLLQAYGEGFEIMQAKKDFDLDLRGIAHLWNQGSVIRSWLLELAEDVFKKSPHLVEIEGYVIDSGEGRWTVLEAINEEIPAPVISLSLLERFRSRQKESFSAKVIAALRNEFGGHEVKRKKPEEKR
jgi:6-phosphogluconate dehydrogenase